MPDLSATHLAQVATSLRVDQVHLHSRSSRVQVLDGSNYGTCDVRLLSPPRQLREAMGRQRHASREFQVGYEDRDQSQSCVVAYGRWTGEDEAGETVGKSVLTCGLESETATLSGSTSRHPP